MKRTGLERNRWIGPVDDFVRQHGHATPRWAVFLTYNIDLERFARTVLPTLARQGRRFRTIVLSDQGALEKSLMQSRPEFRGAVNLHPIRCRGGGVFHAKLAFLRAGRHVRACFGSANITDGGMGTNLELWTSTESPEILAGIQEFLLAVTRSPDLAVDDGACRNLCRALSGLVGCESPAVWSSLHESFADRLARGPERHAARAIIVSPMYASGGGVSAARAAIRAKNVSLYTDIPASPPKCPVFVYSPPDLADRAEDDDDYHPRKLHAKAYVFHPRDGESALAWVGSANFTAQALTKSVADGGNVELMIRTRLPKDEVDALESDLYRVFERCEKPTGRLTPADSRPPKASATILACELVGSASTLRLHIQTTQRQGHVILKNIGRSVRVTVKNGRGVVEGATLRRLLPEIDLTAAHVLVIYQLVRGEEIPVIVNIPHVPPDDGTGTCGHASLDTLLDDLLGRIPINRLKDKSEGDEDEPEGSASDGNGNEADDEESREFERRLDQVRHQGEIDQLAVKAALLKKLAVRTTALGAERDDMSRYIVNTLLPVTPSHLQAAIRSLFNLNDPAKTT